MIPRMKILPKHLYSADQVREFDRIAIEEHDIPGYQLMQQAGAVAYQSLEKHWPQAERILVVCGPGNNGGDGYVIARLCHESGLAVEVVSLTDTAVLKGDAKTAFDDAVAAGVSVNAFAEDTDCDQYDVIIDALFGTGLRSELEGDAKLCVEKINAASIGVLAVDIPSGLLADTGMPLGSAVEADVTVTFIGLKQGLFTGMAVDYCGELEFSDLDVPAAVYQSAETARRYVGDDVPILLAPRKRSTHKGQCGHVLAVGGREGYVGAIRMAGEAAARVGAGLVSVAGLYKYAALIAFERPDIMAFTLDKASVLVPLTQKADIFLIGPGMGTDGVSVDLWHRLMSWDTPMVIDADGLNLLAENFVNKDNWILTPHPGEAARLLEISTAEVQANRFDAVKALQKRYGGVVVLKGAGTLVCDQQGDVSVINVGNPGMASGGMGDVLAGVITGLAVQGLPLIDAARAGVWLHGTAADQAVATMGERGLLATDLLPHLRRLVNPY